jgi:tRNA(adenine34) deaminase
MRLAIKESMKCTHSMDVPIGSVIVKDSQIIAKAHNEVEKRLDPTAHSELLAIRKAIRKIGYKHLSDCIIYTTLEPCSMCAGAIVLARIPVVVWGADDPKSGAGGSVVNLLQNPKLNHRTKIINGILADECSLLLKDFFKILRKYDKTNNS